VFYLRNVTVACIISVLPQAHFKQGLVLVMADAWFFHGDIVCYKALVSTEKASHKVKMTKTSVRSNIFFFFL